MIRAVCLAALLGSESVPGPNCRGSHFLISTELVAAAAEAYVYGYPLGYNLAEIARPPAAEPAVFANTVVPWNSFDRVRDLLNWS